MTDAPPAFEDRLQGFRDQYLSTAALLGWLVHRPARKGLLVGMAGLGKSRAAQRLVVDPATYRHFDRVVVAVDQNRVLDAYEAQARRSLTAGVHVLRARPARNCGRHDAAWRVLERSGFGALGKSSLCTQCERSGICGWPHQGETEILDQARLILGVQEYLRAVPGLLAPRQGRRQLVVLEEIRDLTDTTSNRIEIADVQLLQRTLHRLSGEAASSGALKDLRGLLDHLASGGPLERVPALPALGRELVTRIQEALAASGDTEHRNILPELYGLVRHRDRWREGKTIIYRDTLPLAPHTVLALSTGAPVRLARSKLRLDALEEVLDAAPPRHPGTRYVNLKNTMGARSRFPGNAKRLMDFAAAIAVRRLQEGGRILLISCKQFTALCREGMEARLAQAVGGPVPIHVAAGQDEDVASETRVALVHYGMTGSNSFEDFDLCVCLNSYYVPPEAVAVQLRDVLPHRIRPTVHIVTDVHGNRRVRVDTDSAAVQALAEDIFFHLEALTILQAIGRCRPNTRPRTVILQHTGLLPLNTEDVRSLEDLRQLFGVSTARASSVLDAIKAVHALRMKGLGIPQIVEATGLSESTVRRHLKGVHDV